MLLPEGDRKTTLISNFDLKIAQQIKNYLVRPSKHTYSRSKLMFGNVHANDSTYKWELTVADSRKRKKNLSDLHFWAVLGASTFRNISISMRTFITTRVWQQPIVSVWGRFKAHRIERVDLPSAVLCEIGVPIGSKESIHNLREFIMGRLLLACPTFNRTNPETYSSSLQRWIL